MITISGIRAYIFCILYLKSMYLFLLLIPSKLFGCCMEQDKKRLEIHIKIYINVVNQEKSSLKIKWEVSENLEYL